MLFGPPTPLLVSMAVASTPLFYNNFSFVKLLEFYQYAIPIFLILRHDPSGSAMLRPVNSVPIILACFLSSTLLNLLVSVTIITLLEELRPVNNIPITLAHSPLPIILTLSAPSL